MMKRFLKHFQVLESQPWLTFLLIFALMLARCWTNADPDFGWHLRAGEHFRANGVQMVEPFTYTASDFPWVNHEAASDMALSAAYNFGEQAFGNGFALLAVIYAGFYTLSFFLVWRVSRRGKQAVSPWLLLVGAVAILPFAGVRTLTLSMLLLAILVWLLADLPRTTRRLVFVPVLFLAWANLHGSFVVGLCYFGYKIFYEVAIGRPVIFAMQGFWARAWRNLWKMRWAVLVLALSFAATFANFYGWQVYEEVFRTLGDSNLAWTIVEWRPDIPASLWPYLLLFALGWILQLSRPGFRLRDLLTVENVFFAAAVTAQRHWPLFVLVAFAPMTHRLYDGLMPFYKEAKNNRKLRRFLTGMTIGLAVATGLLGLLHVTLPSARPNYAAREAVIYLRKNPCDGNVFNTYNAGGYLIWQLPEYKVYIDGRMPSWAWDGKNYLADYYRVKEDAAFRAEEFARYDICAAVLYSGGQDEDLVRALMDEGWRTATDDGQFVLLVK
jgi:hypothetical protein